MGTLELLALIVVCGFIGWCGIRLLVSEDAVPVPPMHVCLFCRQPKLRSQMSPWPPEHVSWHTRQRPWGYICTDAETCGKREHAA